jgi:hypothetical protein
MSAVANTIVYTLVDLCSGASDAGVAKLHHSKPLSHSIVPKTCKVGAEKVKQQLYPFRILRFGLNFFNPRDNS